MRDHLREHWIVSKALHFRGWDTRLSRLQTAFVTLNVAEDEYERGIEIYRQFLFTHQALHIPAKNAKDLDDMRKILWPETVVEVQETGSLFYRLSSWTMVSPHFMGYQFEPEEAARLQEM